TPDDGGGERVDVRGRVRDDEVLAAGLADYARVVAVGAGGDVRADLLPHPVEHTGRAREVDAREVAVRKRRIADLRAVAVDEVDHARREPRLLVQLHQPPGRVR